MFFDIESEVKSPWVSSEIQVRTDFPIFSDELHEKIRIATVIVEAYGRVDENDCVVALQFQSRRKSNSGLHSTGFYIDENAATRSPFPGTPLSGKTKSRICANERTKNPTSAARDKI